MTFRYDTAHSSKGQEADFVIVLDVNDGRWGWPSQIEDDPLLQLVLPAEEPYLFAEERRLFYVAVTRARHHTYMLSDIYAPSVFVQEMLDGHHKDYAFDHLVTEGGREGTGCGGPLSRVATDGSSGSPRHPANSMAVRNFPYCEERAIRCERCRTMSLRAPNAHLCLRQYGLSAHPTHLSTVWNGCVTGENGEVWPLPRLLKLRSRTLHVHRESVRSGSRSMVCSAPIRSGRHRLFPCHVTHFRYVIVWMADRLLA